MIITEAKLQAAVDLMVATDEDIAIAKVEVARKEYLCKVARARIFLNAEGSVEQKKALAESSQEVDKAQEAYFIAMGQFEKVKANRETNTLIIEVWRSENKARKEGNL
ncbi:MAG: hypothetical protein NUV74_05480 [Candidatus Brocadiaceae bacterium]|nr:hypothetical protein [Candidatus Brocadiaceae bacterium]